MATDQKVSGEYLGVMIGEVRVGIATEFVQEVFETTLITRLPGSPDLFLGMVNVRGNIIPVLDLLAIVDPSAPIKKIVILKTAEGIVGLLISRLIDLMKFSSLEKSGDIPQQLKQWGTFFPSTAVVEETFYIMDVNNLFAATLTQTKRQA